MFYLFGGAAIQRVFPSLMDPENVDALARHITAFAIGGINGLRAAANPR